jgi:hypothetical protein
MRVFESPVLTAQSACRQQVFAALVSAPDRDWTVAQMAELMPDVSVQGVRTTLHLLLGDHLVEIEPVTRRSSLTLRLTSDGEQTLTAILRRWATGDSAAEKDAPAHVRQ